MEKFDAIINFKYEEYIAAIIEGIKKFVELFNKYFPKSYYNFEKPEEYEF